MPNVDSSGAEMWQRILEQIADDLDSIVEDFLLELQSSSLYQRGAVEVADLRHTAHETFRYLLDRLMGKPVTTHQREAAKRLGIRRAGQEIYLEDLMAAIRLDFIVLWRHIRRILEPEELPVLADNTEIILTTIELYIREVQLEFLAERARMARDTRLATERHLARLLNSTHLTEPSVELIAQGLKVPSDGTFDVVVIHESAVLEAQDALAEPLATGKILGYPYRSCYSLLRLEAAEGPRLMDQCAEFAGGYLPKVQGLEAVPQAVTALHGLLKYTDRSDETRLTRLVGIDQLWPAALSETLANVMPDFPERYLEGLQKIPSTELREVVGTVHTFLNNGSVQETAVTVERHRNTVINRLKTFETSTGLNVRIPREAVLATLILADPIMQMHK